MGSYSHDMKYMRFNTVLNYDESIRRTVLDYELDIKPLKKEDLQWYWEGTKSNYSLAGFEMKFHRYVAKYLLQYYLPSGLFVVTSWV